MTLALSLKLVEKAKNFDELLAQNIAKYALDGNPESLDAFNIYANICLNLEDLDGFRKALEAYRERSGEDDLYFHNLGVLNFYRGDLKEALPNFEKAVAIKWRIDTAAELCIHNFLLGNKKEATLRCHQILTSDFKTDDYGDLAAYLLYFMAPSPAHTQLINEAIARKPFDFSNNIFRMIALRFHRAIEIVDNKAEFERLIRLSKSPVKRPETYVFPDDASGQLELPEGVWIKKVAAGRGGQDVEIKSAPTTFEASPGHVVQEYITNPYLIHDKKFHVRMHFVISDIEKGEIYLFHDGLIRFAPEPFSEEFENIGRHITNTVIHGIDLSDGGGVLHQNLQQRLVWTFREFINYMDDYHDIRGLEEKFSEQVKNIVDVLRVEGGILEQVKSDFTNLPPLYMGVDMLLDADLNVWVLELQKRPALQGAWPMIEFIAPFFKHMFDLVHNRPEDNLVDETLWTRI